MASRILKTWPEGAKGCGRFLNSWQRVNTQYVRYVYVYKLGQGTYNWPCHIYPDGSAALCEECAVKLGAWW